MRMTCWPRSANCSAAWPNAGSRVWGHATSADTFADVSLRYLGRGLVGARGLLVVDTVVGAVSTLINIDACGLIPEHVSSTITWGVYVPSGWARTSKCIVNRQHGGVTGWMAYSVGTNDVVGSTTWKCLTIVVVVARGQ